MTQLNFDELDETPIVETRELRRAPGFRFEGLDERALLVRWADGLSMIFLGLGLDVVEDSTFFRWFTARERANALARAVDQ